MCKLHGVRLIKGIKIFESMLKNHCKSTVISKKPGRIKFSSSSKLVYRIIIQFAFLCRGRILGTKMRVRC